MRVSGLIIFALVYIAGSYAQDNTTAAAPQTTTTITEAPTIGPTPAPTPTPTLKPDGDKEAPGMIYQYKLANGTVCLLVQMSVKLNFTFNQSYEEGNETKYKTIEAQWNLPNTTKVDNTSSSCGENVDILALEFFEGWKLSLNFTRNKDGKVTVEHMTLNYIESDLRFENISTEGNNLTTSAKNSDFAWNVPGYKCSSMQDVTGFNKGNATALHDLKTFDVRMEAFRTSKDDTFGKNVAYCAADTTVSNIVPIAVGAALAGLVLIVLVAYLIGRSRNKRGYESV